MLGFLTVVVVVPFAASCTSTLGGEGAVAAPSHGGRAAAGGSDTTFSIDGSRLTGEQICALVPKAQIEAITGDTADQLPAATPTARPDCSSSPRRS